MNTAENIPLEGEQDNEVPEIEDNTLPPADETNGWPDDPDNDHEQGDDNDDDGIVLAEYNEDIEKLATEALIMVDSMRDERKSLNDRMSAIREDLKSKGIPKDVFQIILKINSLDEKQLLVFDTAYSVMRKAIGKPVQGDMFAG